MHERWKGIDMAVSLRFTGYPERAKRIDRELARVGLDALPIWQFPTPAYKVIWDQLHAHKLAKPPTEKRLGHFNCAMGHYRAWTTCLQLGAQHCLIVEDDLLFLRDLGRLDEALAALPGDYDFALLDRGCIETDDFTEIHRQLEARKVNPYWAAPWGKPCNGPCSTGAYMVSAHGLALLVRRWEQTLSLQRGRPVYSCDRLWTRNRLHGQFKLYVAHPNCAIQYLGEVPSLSRNPQDDYYARYLAETGVNAEDYGA